jgi:hypothetical protein
MSVIEPIDCLTALVVGFHYKKPRYSIANFFNEILDQMQDLPGFTVSSIHTHELIMEVGKVRVSLSHQNLIINSPIVVAEKLHSLIAKDVKEGKVPIPNIYGPRFDLEEPIMVLKEGPKRFRDGFLADSIEMTRLLDKIVMGLPPLRFAGFVEYYVIPLNHVTWDILERFNREAHILDGENTEKRSINRYYFPKTDKLDEQCFIFHLLKQNNHNALEAVLAGASFDYQFMPDQQETKNLDGYGGAENLIKSLSTGMGQILTRSKFMSFSSRDENHVN